MECGRPFDRRAPAPVGVCAAESTRAYELAGVSVNLHHLWWWRGRGTASLIAGEEEPVREQGMASTKVVDFLEWLALHHTLFPQSGCCPVCGLYHTALPRTNTDECYCTGCQHIWTQES